MADPSVIPCAVEAQWPPIGAAGAAIGNARSHPDRIQRLRRQRDSGPGRSPWFMASATSARIGNSGIGIASYNARIDGVLTELSYYRVLHQNRIVPKLGRRVQVASKSGRAIRTASAPRIPAARNSAVTPPSAAPDRSGE